jgi:hypothetical protein
VEYLTSRPMCCRVSRWPGSREIPFAPFLARNGRQHVIVANIPLNYNRPVCGSALQTQSYERPIYSKNTFGHCSDTAMGRVRKRDPGDFRGARVDGLAWRRKWRFVSGEGCAGSLAAWNSVHTCSFRRVRGCNADRCGATQPLRRIFCLSSIRWRRGGRW